jgi:hypothetical protein
MFAPRNLLVVVCALVVCLGCATSPYRYGEFRESSDDAPREVVVEHGKPHKTLDRVARVIGWPKRLIPWERRVDSHELSPETLDKLTDYLEKNDLTDVHVYINHYDPKSQWQRLRQNDRVSPAWRYSAGSLSMLAYTLFPSRVFGGDRYNPYTNSLYLNSDVPAVALDEAAVAKDIHARKYPGTYAAVTELPVVNLVRQSRAVSDVISYARDEEDWDVEKQAYHVLYPRMGAEGGNAGATFWSVWWGGPLLSLGGAAVGHVTGHAVAARREAQLAAFHAETAPQDDEPLSSTDDQVRQATFTEREVGPAKPGD